VREGKSRCSSKKVARSAHHAIGEVAWKFKSKLRSLVGWRGSMTRVANVLYKEGGVVPEEGEKSA